MEDILKKIKDPAMLDEIDTLVKFHGHLSTGAFIGLHMYHISRRLLEIEPSKRFYVTSETGNCVPDPFQILGGCTIGNGQLKIEDYGKMAAVINKRAEKDQDTMKGIRIVLDPEKTIQYPKLHAWYMNLEKISHEEALSDLIEAGESVYSYEFMDVAVPEKKKKNIFLCEKCGESFISWNNSRTCIPCQK